MRRYAQACVRWLKYTTVGRFQTIKIYIIVVAVNLKLVYIIGQMHLIFPDDKHFFLVFVFAEEYFPQKCFYIFCGLNICARTIYIRMNTPKTVFGKKISFRTDDKDTLFNN